MPPDTVPASSQAIPPVAASELRSLARARVSCAWTKVALEVAGSLGIAEDLLNPGEGEKTARKGRVIDLRNARSWMDWGRFLEFVEGLRQAAPGRSALIRFGAAMNGGRSRRSWLGWITGPALVYRTTLRLGWSRVLRGAACTVSRPASGRLACEVRLPLTSIDGSTGEGPDAEAAEAFLWITAGQLGTLGTAVLGGSPARVDTTISADRRAARYEIDLPESRTLVARGARFLRILVSSRRVARTLLGQHGELSQARIEMDQLHGEFQELMENAPDGILVHDDGRVLYANPALARSLGVDNRDELLGASIDSYLSFDDRASFRSAISSTGVKTETADAGARTITLRGRRRSDAAADDTGGSVYFELACSRPIRHSGQLAQLVMVKDVTERRRLERQLMEAGDGERRKLAMDLHDGLGQLLSGISFRAETLRKRLRNDAAPDADTLSRDLVQLSKQAMQQARALARGLDPVGKFEGGLPVALENLARLTREIHGLKATVHNAVGDNLALDPNDEIQLYRIAQEAVNNATRHAKATRIDIAIRPAPSGRFTLTVRDEGIGCSLLGLDGSEAPHDGLGIKIMKFRAESIGADLSIDSTPGGGTTVSCTFAPKGPAGRETEHDHPGHLPATEMHRDV